MSDKAQAILAAAVRVFSRKGFAGAKVEEIAREAGVGKGTVYEYFTSKHQVFEQMVRHALETHIAMLKQAMEEGKDLRDSMERVLESSFYLFDQRRDLARVLIETPTGGPSPALRTTIFRLQEEFVAAVRDTIRRYAGGDTAYDPTLAAHVFIGALNAVSVSRLLSGDFLGGGMPAAGGVEGDGAGGAGAHPLVRMPPTDLARAVAALLLEGMETSWLNTTLS